MVFIAEINLEFKRKIIFIIMHSRYVLNIHVKNFNVRKRFLVGVFHRYLLQLRICKGALVYSYILFHSMGINMICGNTIDTKTFLFVFVK